MKGEETAVLQVEHPKTGEPMEGTTIVLASMDSEQARAIARSQRSRRLGKVAQAPSAAAGRKAAIKDAADSAEGDDLDYLVGCTRSWAGIVWKGRQLECTPDNARMLYAELPWLMAQVNEFVGNRANFFR